MNSDSNSEISSLRSQLFVMLIALVVLSGTLSVYLYRQVSVLGKDLTLINQTIATSNQNQAAIVNFANQLAVYSRTHPDLAPILAKYGIGPNGLPVAPKK